MVLGQRGTAVLGRPAGLTVTITDPEESEGTGSARAKSSLTVIQNPSLEGRLGILMAGTTILNGDETSFLNAYVMEAYGDALGSNMLHLDIAKSTKQRGNPLLYVLAYSNGSPYHTASQLPHEICKITDEEFRKFEAALTTPNQRAVELTGMLNNMVQLIGQRVDAFSLDNGKLVLPPNYANTRFSSQYI